MVFTSYRLNEGTIDIPENWQDQSMNVFVLPDDSGINLVINRSKLPYGIDEEEYYSQLIHQFRTTLKNYQEIVCQSITLSNNPAKLLEYQWLTPEGKMYQLTVMQIYHNQLLTFTYTASEPFTASRRQALLDIIYTFKLSDTNQIH